MANIKDVSKVSGISIATVSKYLNGKHVCEDSRRKIAAAIEELDYEVNPLARSFRTHKTMTVGVLVNQLRCYYYMDVLDSMERAFNKLGYSMLISCAGDDAKREVECAKKLVDRYVDGIVWVPYSNSRSDISGAVAGKVPVVAFDRTSANCDYPCVVSDNSGGAYTAAEYLFAKGHRKIAVIAGPDDVTTMRERVKGVMRAYEDYGIHKDCCFVSHGEFSNESGAALTKQALETHKPTAIIVLSNDLLAGVLDVIRENGLNIPNDISLMTFDDYDYLRLISPRISVINQPCRELGAAAAEVLVGAIKNGEAPQVTRLKCSLIEGGSVAVI